MRGVCEVVRRGERRRQVDESEVRVCEGELEEGGVRWGVR